MGVVLVFELLGGSYLVFCEFCRFCCMLFDYLVLMLQVPFYVFLGGGPGKMGVGGGEKRRFSLEKRSERPWPLWGRGELKVLLRSTFHPGFNMFSTLDIS